MGGTTNIKMELMPCPIFKPVSPISMKTALAATPIKPLTNRITRKMRILIPVDCFKFSDMVKGFIFAAKIHFL